MKRHDVCPVAFHGGLSPINLHACIIKIQDLSEFQRVLQLARLCEARQIPKLLRPFIEALAVLPAEVPLPLSLLSQLWRTSVNNAQAAAEALQQLACMRLATLQDGSAWGLIPSGVSQQIQVWVPGWKLPRSRALQKASTLHSYHYTSVSNGFPSLLHAWLCPGCAQ